MSLRKRMQKKGNITDITDSDRPRSYPKDEMAGLFRQQQEMIEEAQAESGSMITAVQAGKIQTGGFLWTPTGLQAVDDITAEDIEFTGQMLKMVDSSLQWLIGDWLLHAEHIQYGDIKELAEELGFVVETIYEYKSVAKAVETSIRMEVLSFGHHQLVRAKDAKEQKEWLNKAVANKWSVRQLREEINGKKQLPDLTVSDHLDKAYLSVSRITDSLVKSGADKADVIRILQQKIEELQD